MFAPVAEYSSPHGMPQSSQVLLSDFLHLFMYDIITLRSSCRHRCWVNATPHGKLLFDPEQTTHLLQCPASGLHHGVAHEQKGQDANTGVYDVQAPADCVSDGWRCLSHNVTSGPQAHGTQCIALGTVGQGKDLAGIGPRPDAPADVEEDIE
jgi:hypothetical protein